MSIYLQLMEDFDNFFKTGDISYIDTYHCDFKERFKTPEWEHVVKIQGIVTNLYLYIVFTIDHPARTAEKVFTYYLVLQNLYFRMKQRFGESTFDMNVYEYKPLH